jgi:hypothetical protein
MDWTNQMHQTLFRMITGESWNGIMRDLAIESPFAWIYCITFIVLMQLMFMNLFVAIVLGNFDAVLTKSKKDVISDKSLAQFVDVWQHQVDFFEEQVRERLMKTRKRLMEPEPSASVAERPTGLSAWKDLSIRRKSEEVDERCYRLALSVMDTTYLPSSAFAELFVRLRPPLGLPLARSLSPSDLMRFIRIAQVPITKTGMISARATLAALIDHALETDADDENYELMHSALKLRMLYDPQSAAAHKKVFAEKASTHTIAEEIATRRLQLTTRYLLARRKVERSISEGIYTPENGFEMIEQLSLQYNRDIVASLLRFDLIDRK